MAEASSSSAPDLLQKEKTSSDYYWNSYAHYGIHEEMLKDKVRTISYRKSILDNKPLFKDKIVLDVGCGTGILSMFASQAGAKHVYAVDSSDIIIQARQIVKDNHFENKITCIQGKMEEIQLPCKVDIIISEWMGYFLLYETMLPTVLKARDTWLAPGGLIFPDKAELFIACIEDADYKDEKIEYWNNVYGFDFSCIQAMAYREPLVDSVNADSVVTTASKILSLDLNTCKVEDLTFASTFSCTGQRNDFVHALIAWFDITFSCCHKPVYFSTSLISECLLLAPNCQYTHWKQTVFYLKDCLSISRGDILSGTIRVAPNKKNERDLDIQLHVDFEGRYQKLHIDQDYVIR